MANSVSNVYIQTYERTVRHLAQQSITRLRPWVDERSVQSSAHNWETLAKGLATKKSGVGVADAAGRQIPTPVDDYGWDRRISRPSTWHTGDLTEQEDIVQMLVDPNSNIAQAQGKAMRRAMDTAIITAAVGASENNGGSVAYNTDQQIGVADTPVPMSYDLVTEVTEKFMAADIDPDEEKVFVVGPAQARKLLQLTEATSGDYNAVRPLTSKGYIESWMGYSWVVSTLLPDSSTSGSGGAENYCFAMTKRAIGLQINKDIWVRVAEDPSVSFAWRVYCAGTFGAVRVEDQQLVRIFAQTAV